MSADSFIQGLTSPFYKVKSEAEQYAEKFVKTWTTPLKTSPVICSVVRRKNEGQ